MAKNNANNKPKDSEVNPETDDKTVNVENNEENATNGTENVENNEENAENNTENAENDEETAESNGTMKVKMRCGYWGTYGVFKPNDVVELSEKVAKNFIKNEIAIEMKD